MSEPLMSMIIMMTMIRDADNTVFFMAINQIINISGSDNAPKVYPVFPIHTKPYRTPSSFDPASFHVKPPSGDIISDRRDPR